MEYQIKFVGKIDNSWSDWFDKARITSNFENDGTCITTMTVSVIDQPALFGILDRIRDMNLLPISVEQIGGEK
jgi:hypothetical protein